MPNLSLTEIIVLLDRSGSMASLQKDVCGGFDQFVAEQAKLPGDCQLTLVQFDSTSIDTVHEAKPVKDVPALSFQPRGSTPLLDAMGDTITTVGERLQRTGEDKRPEKVIFLVITDGEENASTRYTKEKIKTMVEHQTKTYNWVFSYLGANVDAFAEAASLGIARGASANYVASAHGMRAAISTASASAGSYRSSPVGAAAASFSISDEDRKKMMEKK